MNSPRPMKTCDQVWIVFCLVAALAPAAQGQTKQDPGKSNAQSWPWREFIETDFPFFSTTFDGTAKSADGLEENLVPRAMVFPLADDCFLAYDIDLLRVAAVWTAGEVPFDNANLAVNSYPYELKKVAPGTDSLPQPNGEIWFRNGLYAGVGTGEPRIVDPRPQLTDEEMVVRGGLDPSLARFLGVDLTDGVEIQYEVGGVRVSERFARKGQRLVRHLQVSPHHDPIFLVLAKESDDIAFQCH